jgi:hypothetical protein
MLLIVVGLLVLAYGAAVLFWRDPVTDLYARYQQHKLAGELKRAWPDYRTGRWAPTSTAATRLGSPQ